MKDEHQRESSVLNNMCEIGEIASSLGDKVAVQLNALAIISHAADTQSIDDVEIALQVCRQTMETTQDLLSAIRSLHFQFIRFFLYQEGAAASPEWSPSLRLGTRTAQNSGDS